MLFLEDPDDDNDGTAKTIQEEPLEEHNKPGMFESDIRLVEAQSQILNNLMSEDEEEGGDDEDRLIEKRKGIGNLANRWPQGIVPYKINESSEYRLSLKDELHP